MGGLSKALEQGIYSAPMRRWTPLPLFLLLASLPAHGGVEEAREAHARGLAALEAGDEAGARRAFLQATEEAPTWILPALDLGDLAAKRKDGVGEARALLLRVGPYGKGNPRLHRLLGDLGEIEGNDAAAAAAWEESLRLLGDQERVRAARAAALERLGRHGEAAEEYGRLVADHPHDLVYRARFAHALEQAGAFAEARAQLRILVERQQGQEAPLRRLARFHERRGEVEEARRLHAQADRAGNRPPERKLRPLLPSKW